MKLEIMLSFLRRLDDKKKECNILVTRQWVFLEGQIMSRTIKTLDKYRCIKFNKEILIKWDIRKINIHTR